MPHVNLERTKKLAVRAVGSLQAQALNSTLKRNGEALANLKQLKAVEIRAYIDRDADLKDYLPADVYRSDWTRRIAALNPDVLLEILATHNLPVKRELETPEGRAWWSRQRRQVLGRLVR